MLKSTTRDHTSTTRSHLHRIRGTVTRVEDITAGDRGPIYRALLDAGVVRDEGNMTAVYAGDNVVLFRHQAATWPVVSRALRRGIAEIEAIGRVKPAREMPFELPGASYCMSDPATVVLPKTDANGHRDDDHDMIVRDGRVRVRSRVMRVDSPGYCLECKAIVLRDRVRVVSLQHGEYVPGNCDATVGSCTRCYGSVLRMDQGLQRVQDTVTIRARESNTVSVDTLEYGRPAAVLIHWVRHNGRVAPCGVSRSEAWVAEQGRLVAYRDHIEKRLRVERDLARTPTAFTHRFTHSQPALVNCPHCRHEMESAMLVGLSASESGPRCDRSCERGGNHSVYRTYECGRCRMDYTESMAPLILDPAPGDLGIPMLMNHEREDLALLTDHHPGLPALV